MLKQLSLSAIAIAACLTLLGDGPARGQTLRQEARIAARQPPLTLGWPAYYYGPSYYLPGGFYAGPPYYRGAPGYYGGYYRAPGYVAAPRYAAPAYNGPSDRAYLGITMSETPEGVVRVSGVRPYSPADKAGIRPGDVLLAMDGREIYSAQDLTRMVASHVPGEVVRLDIDRNGQTEERAAVLGTPGNQLVPLETSRYPVAVQPYETVPAERGADVFINAY